MPRIRRINRSSYEVGHIVISGSGDAPIGTLLCNGAEVSRTTYSILFEKIGVSFGAGDGVSTFNLPDFRSRMPLGSGQGGGLSNRVLGTSLGEENVSLTSSHIPSHGHPSTTTFDAGTAANQREHQHTYVIPTGSARSGDFSGHWASSLPAATMTTVAAHNHSITLSNPTGSAASVAHENMSPYLVLNFYIAFK